jgi:hypothetical protein
MWDLTQTCKTAKLHASMPNPHKVPLMQSYGRRTSSLGRGRRQRNAHRTADILTGVLIQNFCSPGSLPALPLPGLARRVNLAKQVAARLVLPL